ncbi:MAG TPA: hypothetical protein PLP42_00740 [Acidobacteriota bacterium]|nr:hypothetical protein [Acidobacteriota bacterium]
MNIAYLLIPLFFIALILYVSWPLLNEANTPADDAKKQRQRPARKK